MRTAPILCLLAFLPGLGGCCGLSRLLCGADRTPWISERYDTPRHTLQTLFEALRRDDPDTLAKCLDLGYRRRLVGTGDTLVLRVLWDRFRAENPYLHVAGYTDVPEVVPSSPDRATVALEVAGEPVAIDLTRVTVWEVRYDLPDAPRAEIGGTVASFAERAELTRREGSDHDDYELRLAPFVFPHYGFEPLPLAAIEHAALTTRWFVTDIRRRS